MLHQEGQVFELKSCGRNGTRLWAYRYRVGGRGSRRVQRGGFASAEDALALERAVDAGWTSARRPATPHSETVSRPHRRRLAAAVDARWTAQLRSRRTSVNRRARLAATSLSPLTDSNVDPLSMKGGRGVKWRWWCIAQSGRVGWVVSSGAHLSIASCEEDQAGWEVRSGGASPYGTVRRPGGRWRLPERRAGCG
jgi:hypothetical protein